MSAKYTADQIAQWFISRSNYDVNHNGGEYITHLKLQKLLYYAQGCYGAINDKPLFDEKIYNWTHGPVVKDIYDKYKDFADKGIDLIVPHVKIDEDTEAILEEVYRVFGKFSAWALRDMTHKEAPWKNTEQDEEITFKSIVDYFKREIVTE